MGTIIANMLPYSIVFAIAWIILLLAFMIFNIPLGPGGAILYSIQNELNICNEIINAT